MAELTTAQRKKIPTNEFGIPKERKFPMPDRAHAANAKTRATQQEEKGNITPAQKAKIDRKANAILRRGKKVGRKRKIGLLSM